MQNIKDPNQAYFFSLWSHLGPIRQRLLDESWAGLFREYLLKELPVGIVAPHFHLTMGRPTKELYTVLGTLLLQQLNDLSDSEVIYSLAFDMRWHYALDIVGNSDASTTICERTLRTYRRIVIETPFQRTFHAPLGAFRSKLVVKERFDDIRRLNFLPDHQNITCFKQRF